jgi:hypothetical protein
VLLPFDDLKVIRTKYFALRAQPVGLGSTLLTLVIASVKDLDIAIQMINVNALRDEFSPVVIRR